MVKFLPNIKQKVIRMVNRFGNKVEHLTNAIKVINDLIEDIPSKYTTSEYDELAIIFQDANKMLVEKLAELV